MITDNKIFEIMRKPKFGALDYRKEKFCEGTQTWVDGSEMKYDTTLAKYINTNLGGELTNTLIVDMSYTVSHSFLTTMGMDKEQCTATDIVLRGKYSHGLTSSWETILNLFLIFDTVIIEAERLSLFGEVGFVNGTGVLDISKVNHLSVSGFNEVKNYFKRIIYNPKSRSLGMLGLYFHQRLQEKGLDIYHPNSHDVCVGDWSIDLSKLKEIHTLAVLGRDLDFAKDRLEIDEY